MNKRFFNLQRVTLKWALGWSDGAGIAPTVKAPVGDEGYDFAYIHVEAPDEMGHQGSVERKIKAVENLDEKVIKTVVEGLKNNGEDFRLVITPDHPTPIRVRTHVSTPVPYMLYDSTDELDRTWKYNETDAANSKNYIANGYNLIDKLFEK